MKETSAYANYDEKENIKCGRQKQVPTQIMELEGSIATLEGVSNDLFENLRGVSNQLPTATLKEVSEQQTLVPLADALQSLQKRVDVVVTKMRGCISGLEL